VEHGEREWNQRSTGRENGVKERNVGMEGERGRIDRIQISLQGSGINNNSFKLSVN